MSLTICHESRRTCETSLRGLDVPGIRWATGTHSSSCVPEVGALTGDTSVVCIEKGCGGRADASEFGGFQNESRRTASLVAGLKVAEQVGVNDYNEEAN